MPQTRNEDKNGKEKEVVLDITEVRQERLPPALGENEGSERGLREIVSIVGLHF